MPGLKDILVQQTAVPRSIEAALPSMAPKLSDLMVGLANALPAGPSLPEAPMGIDEIPTQITSGFPNIIKGIESGLPGDMPMMAGLQAGFPGASGYRSISLGRGKAALPNLDRVMGGGYRSIS